ncbi:hypothetical protein H6P81_012349 [Aristolochia fimbriata]|uniref:Uncharacterized protein n=1 Tax=Aristolochia fimbriata TaxID=158543 RepID=A0AAV7EEM9_ARIFI|nr:hypothetical protein H6P81_012349 [Aristolochia fimbriata]
MASRDLRYQDAAEDAGQGQMMRDQAAVDHQEGYLQQTMNMAQRAAGAVMNTAQGAAHVAMDTAQGAVGVAADTAQAAAGVAMNTLFRKLKQQQHGISGSQVPRCQMMRDQAAVDHREGYLQQTMNMAQRAAGEVMNTAQGAAHVALDTAQGAVGVAADTAQAATGVAMNTVNSSAGVVKKSVGKGESQK